MKQVSKSLTIDEAINAVDSLERAGFFLKQCEADPLSWKWVSISLYSALYGFAICNVTLTSDVVSRTKKGKEKLLGFDDALTLCKAPIVMECVYNGKPLKLSPEQSRAISHLKNTFRNNFEHFTPKTWVIALRGLPQMTGHVVQVIRFLGLESGVHVFSLGKYRNRIRQAIADIEETLWKC